MKTSKALRLVKRKLWDGREPLNGKFGHLCTAAADALPAQERDKVKRIFMQALHPCSTLESWLFNFHGICCWDLPDCHLRMQITRHAWIDHLIEHYESLGD